jgi:hypothetical protein
VIVNCVSLGRVGSFVGLAHELLVRLPQRVHRPLHALRDDEPQVDRRVALARGACGRAVDVVGEDLAVRRHERGVIADEFHQLRELVPLLGADAHVLGEALGGDVLLVDAVQDVAAVGRRCGGGRDGDVTGMGGERASVRGREVGVIGTSECECECALFREQVQTRRKIFFWLFIPRRIDAPGSSGFVFSTALLT